MNTTINSYDFHSHISNKEQFHELILTQEGNLYIDSALENVADSFYMYYNGNIYCIQGKKRYINGSLPEGHLIFPTIVGATSFHNIEETGCLLHSKEPVLDEDSSAFAVFRYKDMLALYLADSMVSRGIYFVLMDYTSEDEALYSNVFSGLLRRHDPEAAEALAAWQDSYATIRKEVKV